MVIRALNQALVANGLSSCIALLLMACAMSGPLVTRWMADPMAVAVECESASTMDEEGLDAAAPVIRAVGEPGPLATRRLVQGAALDAWLSVPRHGRVPVPPPRG